MSDIEARAREWAIEAIFGDDKAAMMVEAWEDSGPWLIRPVDLADKVATFANRVAREAREAALKEAVGGELREEVLELRQSYGMMEKAFKEKRELANTLRTLLVQAGEALEPFERRAAYLDDTPDFVTHWHPAVGSEVSAGDLRRIAVVSAAIRRATQTKEDEDV